MTAAVFSLAPAHQAYLLQARQMQALSFAVHIPLVCFGIAFPAMVLFVEWLYRRTGDPLYLTLARRWTKVMVALFAVGVITGTILSFEMGLLWPNFTATFGSVFGLGFAIEGFSFFIEAIFIGIYVYGWDRLSARAHFLVRDPDRDRRVHRVADGDLRQRLDEPSVRVSARGRQGRRRASAGGAVREQLPVARVGAHVHRRLHRRRVPGRGAVRVWTAARPVGSLRAHRAGDPVDDRRARGAGAGARRRLGGARGRPLPTRQARRDRGPRARRPAEPRSTSSAGTRDGKVKLGIPIPHGLSVLAFHSWNATVKGLDTVPAADRPPVNVVRIAFQTMVGIGTLLALLGIVFLAIRVRRRRLPQSRWFYRALVLAGPASLVALISGWVTTEVGRQPWVVYGVMRTSQAVTGAGGIPVGYATLALVYAGRGHRRGVDPAAPRRSAAEAFNFCSPTRGPPAAEHAPVRASSDLRPDRAGAVHGSRQAPISAPGSGS